MPALRSLRYRMVKLDRSCVHPARPLRTRLTNLSPNYRQHFLA